MNTVLRASAVLLVPDLTPVRWTGNGMVLTEGGARR